MITKTSREIIKTAKTLANADNSNFTDFFTNTVMLNNAYREAYDVLVSNSKAFVNTIEVTEDTVLPYDCYAIISVTDDKGNPVHQEAMVSTTSDGWWVENNYFIYPKNRLGRRSLFVTYATIPATITAPDKWIDLGTESPYEWESGTKYNVRYDKNTEDVTITANSDTNYLDKVLEYDFENQTFTWGGMDFYDYISRQDSEGNDIKFTNVQVDSPYMAITYADRKVYIFTGWQGTEWNYLCLYGHETRGECHALYTNDTTGFGMIFYNDENAHWYYAPFVPDTILSYPNNTLFAFLEYRIAYQIASLLGMNTQFLEWELDRAENNFYRNLGSSNNVHRMNNYNSRRGLIV